MFDSSAERRPQRADQSIIDKPEPATNNPENQSDTCLGQHAGGTPTQLPSGRMPGRYPARRHGYQSQINPLASAGAGGMAGHDAAACVSARGESDGASVFDARDARLLSPRGIRLLTSPIFF